MDGGVDARGAHGVEPEPEDAEVALCEIGLLARLGFAEEVRWGRGGG